LAGLVLSTEKHNYSLLRLPPCSEKRYIQYTLQNQFSENENGGNDYFQSRRNFSHLYFDTHKNVCPQTAFLYAVYRYQLIFISLLNHQII